MRSISRCHGPEHINLGQESAPPRVTFLYVSGAQPGPNEICFNRVALLDGVTGGVQIIPRRYQSGTAAGFVQRFLNRRYTRCPTISIAPDDTPRLPMVRGRCVRISALHDNEWGFR